MRRSGFTLVEVGVVIAVVGLLSGIISVMLHNTRVRARDEKRVSDLSSIQRALTIAHGQIGLFPMGTNLTIGASGTDVLCGKGDITKFVPDHSPDNCDQDKIFMGQLPIDSNQYIYDSNNTTTNFTVCTILEIGIPKLGLVAGPIEVDEFSSTRPADSCP